ncbi:ribonuclease P [Dimargaris cristalligena]|uniref:Ribonuclease P n=1 Tax=Dimargaris cristalligena TaxID=215637 RepID=A0A4P9ZT83_9FUNG|nr:ribonuclease P [Dimargaris cristalligena]|eukprot:RKP36784.1 ribonuclease P [Dimargaris cristalligena]
MNTRIDQHDVFALTPSGHFIFDLTKDTYELSGLTGGRLTSSPTTTTLPNPVPRFVVTVDLHTDPAFQPGTKAYTRFRWTLDNILNAPAEFALTCIDPQTGAEPAQWHNRLPAAWSPERIDMPAPTWTTTSPTTLGAPFFTQLNSKVARQLPEIFRDRAQEIFEWLGLYYHESPRIAETDRSRQSSISHYQVPKPHQSGVALTLSYSGFLSPYTVLAFYRQLPHLIRKWNESVIDRQDPKAQPAWAALSVWGFKDAPVSYGLKQRNVLSSGENDYSLLLGPDNEGVLYQVCDILDEYS